jgi:syntaxin 7
MRRDEDPQYRDDPGFDHLAETLSDQLFTLTSNISRLSNQIALLGTKRDTERVRERVHNLLEETRAGFKDVGEGIKKVQTWEDVNVRLNSFPCLLERLILTSTVPALPEVDTTEAIV